jgi:predicted transposase YdaD
VIDLTKQMDDKEQLFVIAGILVGTDKFIDKKYAENVRGWFKMTKVGRLLSEESRLQEKKDTAIKMLADGMELVQIMKYTGLSSEEVEDLKEEILTVNN